MQALPARREPYRHEELQRVLAPRLGGYRRRFGAARQASRITEPDLNPLICAGERIAAVDALMVRQA